MGRTKSASWMTALVLIAGGCFKEPPARTKAVTLGKLQLVVPSDFVCKSKGNLYAVGLPTNYSDLLWVYQPKSKTVTPNQANELVAEAWSKMKSHPGAGLRVSKTFDRQIGALKVHLIEFRTETKDLYYYGALTSLEGHLLRFELQLHGGFDHPDSTGSDIIGSIATFRYGEAGLGR